MPSNELFEDKTANDVNNSPTELRTALTITRKETIQGEQRISYGVPHIFLFVTVIRLDSESLKNEATDGGKKFENSRGLARSMVRPTR